MVLGIKRKIFWILISICCCQFSLAQNRSIGLSLKSNGIGMNFEQSKFIKNSGFENLSIVEIETFKDSREVQTPSSIARINRSYVYGKLNSIYNLSFEKGIYYSLFPQSERFQGFKLGVSIGPQLTFIQPYYLLIYNYDQSTGNNPISHERFDPVNHQDQDRIVGKAGFSNALNEISLMPSITSKVVADLSWITNRRFTKSIKAGIEFNYFFRNPSIMYGAESQQFFSNIFVSAHLGKTQ